MTTASIIPCRTQFTVRELEEYLFYRERVRLVIRATTDPKVPVHESTWVGTSYFETQARAQHSLPQSDDMLLQHFVAAVFRSTDVSEISVMFGNGTAIDYLVNGHRSFIVKSSSVITACLGLLTIGDVRHSYRDQKPSIAA